MIRCIATALVALAVAASHAQADIGSGVAHAKVAANSSTGKDDHTGTATLIAAIIAAGAALVTVVTTTVAGRGSEGRAAHRELLKERMAELGEGLHGVIATSHDQHRKLKDQRRARARVEETAKRLAELNRRRTRDYFSVTSDEVSRAERNLREAEKAEQGATRAVRSWRARGNAAAGAVEAVRRQLRYPLAGIETGLREIRRVPDYVGHRQGGEQGERILEHAGKLVNALDEAIAFSWKKGRPPRKRHVKRVRKWVEKLRADAPIGPLGDSTPEPGSNLSKSESS